MPSTPMSWDGYGGQIFPADMPFHHQDTLEAVLQQPETASLQAPAAAGQRVPVVDDGVVHAAAAAPRKRPLRTDRHSKIRTAQGVRDRRMRLSVGVSREFFGLQDLLGFDKPSKTVNWLLTQSKPAIDRFRDAAADPPATGVSGGGPTAVVKGRWEGSSSSTCCLMDTDSREKAKEKQARSRCGGGPPPDDGPPPLMEEHDCDELGWIMSEAMEAAAATTTTTTEQPQQMDGLEYYYQQYCLQVEEMRRCNGEIPR